MIDSIPLKHCKGCNLDQPATAEYFHSDRAKKDGFSTRCKKCRKAYSDFRSKRDSEKNKKRAKNWRANNRQQHREYSHQWKLDNPEKRIKQAKKYKDKYPEKTAARMAVKNAVRRGDLAKLATQECVDCGNQAYEYHHPDYSKPLFVIPLCRQCHNIRHDNEEAKAA